MRDEAYARFDESEDARFYASPRFVEYIDEGAKAAIIDLHREILPAGGEILDCMSSWVSHLPPDVSYARVVGLGMNAEELAANARLNDYVVHDLNRSVTLPFADQSFDGIQICLSIQYLVDPVAVLGDLARVARNGSPIVITISDNCFLRKAVAIWHQLSNLDHCRLVRSYLDATESWDSIEILDRSTAGDAFRRDPLFAVTAKRKCR